MDMKTAHDKHSGLKEKEYHEIHPTNKIHHTAMIYDNVVLGKNNVIGAYCVIGSNGEIRNTKEFKGTVEIGDNNIISEMVTIQRPAEEGEKTKIGSNNLIMAHSHLGHDVEVGDNCEICTGTIIGGYAKIKDGVKLKLGVTVRNRITCNENSIIGMCSVLVKDAEASGVYVGNPAKKINV